MKWMGHSHLHWIFPAILGLAALEVLLSGRDLTEAFTDLESKAEVVRHPLLAWVQRGVSLMLIVGSIERIARHMINRQPVPSPLLAFAFMAYWLTTVAAPGLFGSVPHISHEYAYSLLLGAAALLSVPEDRERVLSASRDALFVFMLAGAVLVPLNPTLTMDTTYAQGLLPGVPRFAGLAVHPVGMGMLAQTALLILWARPFSRRWLNLAAWALGLAVLFVAQSKTFWIAFVLAGLCMFMVRRVPDSLQRIGDPRQGSFGILLCMGVIVAVVAALFSLLVIDLPGLVAGLFDTRQGAQLMSMTGRDRIWVVAMEEWQRSPAFGYGPTLWDASFRAAIGMPNATHAHNQFMDTLARTGSVGAAGLLLYAVVLLVLSIRTARATGGLSLAMFVTIALQSVSEVPLMLYGYGIDVFTHLLLVVTLASGVRRRQRTTVTAAPLPPNFRTAS